MILVVSTNTLTPATASVPMATEESFISRPACLNASVLPASIISKRVVNFEDTNSSGGMSP